MKPTEQHFHKPKHSTKEEGWGGCTQCSCAQYNGTGAVGVCSCGHRDYDHNYQ